MPAVIFTMLVILGLAAAVIAVVVMGMEGTGRARHPEIADAMARTARHLNGEGQPPRGMMLLFDEMHDVSAADLDPRKVPGRIKRSIASARSAASASSAASAPVPETPPTSETSPGTEEATIPRRVPQPPSDATIPQDEVRAWLDSDAEEIAWLPDSANDDGDPRERAADDVARALAAPPTEEFDDPYGVAGSSGETVVHVDLSRGQ